MSENFGEPSHRFRAASGFELELADEVGDVSELLHRLGGGDMTIDCFHLILKGLWIKIVVVSALDHILPAVLFRVRKRQHALVTVFYDDDIVRIRRTNRFKELILNSVERLSVSHSHRLI